MTLEAGRGWPGFRTTLGGMSFRCSGDPLLLLVALVTTLTSSFATAAQLIGFSAARELVIIDSNGPSVTRRGTQLGTAGDTLLAADVHPASLEIVVVLRDDTSGLSRLAILNPTTGDITERALLAAQGQASDAALLASERYGADVDPATGLLRLIGESGSNRRIDVSTGAVTLDTPLAQYPSGDPGFGGAPQIVAAAYAPNVPGGEATLYALDLALDSLVQIGGPLGAPSADLGDARTIASLTFDVSGPTGFDVDAQGRAFVSARLETGSGPEALSRLYSLDLISGALVEVGAVGDAALGPLVAIAALGPEIAFTSRGAWAAEGGEVSIEVVRRGFIGEAASVQWNVVGASARSGEDFAAASGTISFSAMESKKTVSVRTLPDLQVEGLESFFVELSEPQGAGLGEARFRVRITDDDSALAYRLTEDGTLNAFDLLLPETLIASLPLTGIAAGNQVKGLEARPLSQTLHALDEEARLYGIDPRTGVARELGAGPLLTPEDAEWGLDFDPGASALRIVTETGRNLRVLPDAGTLEVDTPLTWDTDGGAPPALVALASGESAFSGAPPNTWAVDRARGTLVRFGGTEVSEGVLTEVGPLGLSTPLLPFSTLDLHPDTRAAFGTLQSTSAAAPSLYAVDLATGEALSLGAIPEQEGRIVGFALAPQTQFRFRSAEYTVAEEEGAARLEVIRRGSLRGSASVQYSSRGITAEVGVDFTGTSGTLRFNPGEEVKTITIDVFADDRIEPQPETFEVVLFGASEGVLLNPTTAQVTLTDFSGQPAVSISDTEVTETDGVAVFQVRLNAAVNRTTRVGYTTWNGTARAREDYVPTEGTLVFAPGETRKSISVELVKTPAEFEGIETFAVQLRQPIGLALSDREGVATIRDSGAGDFALTLSSPTLRSSATDSLAVTVTPLAQPITSPVELSCVGLPEGARCVFSPPRVVPGLERTVARLTVVDESALASRSRRLPWLSFSFALAFTVGAAGRRRRVAAAAVVLTLVLLGFASCAPSSALSGRHAVVVTGTGADGLERRTPLTWVVE